MTKAARYWIGIDLGTSGCRAIAVDAQGTPLAGSRVGLPPPRSSATGHSEQAPGLWWEAVRSVLRGLADQLPERRCVALAVDGTSSTLLLAAADGAPVGPALMYNDRRAVASAAAVAGPAPADSPALGPSASLAKLIHLAQEHRTPRPLLALHQADWVSGRLCGRYGYSDWNNALKLGFDAQRLVWPAWVRRLLPAGIALPRVLAPGTRIGILAPGLAADLGLSPATLILAGTTDSTAAVIAAGAAHPGEAVSCLGSTLVLKVVCAHPLAAARYGVYSQRLGSRWLAGGASNSGGAVLLQHFTLSEVQELSLEIDANTTSGLDYYPLPGVGERFPRPDPGLAPRLDPRPAERGRFLHGLLEGMAAIEAEGYRLLQRLGAPPPQLVLTTGGGSANPAWTRLRERALGLPVIRAEHQDAAYGTALLARSGSGAPTAAALNAKGRK